MRFVKTEIPDCYEIIPQILEDYRGKFVKTFHIDNFEKYGLETRFVEEYFSISKRRVLRGMHFQLPPYAHTKLVYCIQGEVLDVLTDLRIGSPTYGKAIKFNLSAEKTNILYIPIGVAHGFYTISEMAVMIYKTSTIYNPAYDAGILWSSCNIWRDNEPILSERDKIHPHLKDFASPFKI